MNLQPLLRFFGRALVMAAMVCGMSAAALAARPDPAEQVVAAVLDAGIKNDFEAFKKVIHPNEKATAAQLTQLEKYTFTRVVKQSKWYVSGTDADTFVVDRREDTGGGRVKIYVKDLAHPKRAAVPVALEQGSDGTWTVLSTSL